LLLLGDNVYIDLPEQPGPFHRYTYYCRQSRPEFRRLAASTPVYAIWDDHDCAIDDVWMGPYLDRPAWKPATLDLVKENWNNPAYGNARAPGCWFRFAIGEVDFFMLDCRYYRTNPFAPRRTMLGPEQKAWLLDALKKSQATFKVVASSVPWAPGAKPGSHDTWDGFPEERDEIFSAIASSRIGGVLLVSADRHRSDAWRIDRAGGYALYDLSSSRLTNIHTHECMPAALFCYNEQCSFGLLTFADEKDDPQVRYEIVNIDGQTMHSLTLRRSELELPQAGRSR
jgi:alkaline phosphatase D